MIDSVKLTYKHLQEIAEKKGYRWYSKPEDMNFWGIRSAERVANRFDDWFCLCYTDQDNNQHIYCWPGTTDPGTYWLNNPMVVEGTGILVLGQWKNMLRYGLHKGQYEALVQYSPVSLYRDNDKDNVLDMNPAKIQTGMFGVNYHHAGENSQAVDKWSAACQVSQRIDDYNRSMQLFKKQMIAGYGAIFTYTLIEEADLA